MAAEGWGSRGGENMSGETLERDVRAGGAGGKRGRASESMRGSPV